MSVCVCVCAETCPSVVWPINFWHADTFSSLKSPSISRLMLLYLHSFHSRLALCCCCCFIVVLLLLCFGTIVVCYLLFFLLLFINFRLTFALHSAFAAFLSASSLFVFCLVRFVYHSQYDLHNACARVCVCVSLTDSQLQK